MENPCFGPIPSLARHGMTRLNSILLKCPMGMTSRLQLIEVDDRIIMRPKPTELWSDAIAGEQTFCSQLGRITPFASLIRDQNIRKIPTDFGSLCRYKAELTYGETLLLAEK